MKLPKTYIGWTNIKWVISQFFAMYSNQDSYFSKKRFESAIAFIGAMGIILCHVWLHRATLTNSEILSDAALLFTIAGYTVSQIQTEKKLMNSNGQSQEEKTNINPPIEQAPSQ